ncbi:hypothetical protein PR003_g8715, partial [Phytophthora rubi]
TAKPLQADVGRQKANADRRGRKNMSSFLRGERVPLSTDGIQGRAVANLGANKLAPRFIGPFKISKVIDDAYTLDIPTAMRLLSTFYVGRLKPYVPASIPAPEAERPRPARNPSRPAADADVESARALAPHVRASPGVARRTRAHEAASSSRAAPAPTGSEQSPQLQNARAQAQRGSESLSCRYSPDPSPARSSGAPSDMSIRSSETPRPSLKPSKPPKPATLQRPFRVVALKRRRAPTRRPFAVMGADVPSGACDRKVLSSPLAWIPASGGHVESSERLMEDIPDVAKEYEATLALVFDDSSLEDDDDLVSFVAHEYPSLSNDDAIATGINHEVLAYSLDVNSRGASSREHSDDDHATRSVNMDVSTATSSATRFAARSAAMLSSTCTCIARA